ncbi:hypothetical protein D915_005077 [Fasciola hepatica]|uniref:ZZ-type domain-containing protein n=1 Tax=Fasciola hepatica TaxID=6192 RepID=A0A4E0RAG2_FASHE|nr:hypothetical protein D915_005077 [Fasciola hepatica]
MLVKLIFPSRRSPDSKEVCRLNLTEVTKSYTLEGLLLKVREITQLKKAVPFRFYVESKGAYVELTSDALLNEALHQPCKSDCVRIFAIPNAQYYQKPLNSFFSYCHPDELPDILIKKNNDLENRIKDTWLTSPCTLCEREDWSGDRYTCLYCPNIVLCNQCFCTGYHPNHPIMVTRDMSLFSRKVLSLSRVIAATVPWETSLPKPVLKSTASGSGK